MAAAEAMLDEVHPVPPVDKSDQNTYIVGAIHEHNVVIASLPFGVYGTISAAVVASQLRASFPSVRIRLMVGIGGGVPVSDNSSTEDDIRLGDVVVSKPSGTSSGVIQYDFGKTGREGRFHRISCLNKPPQILLTAIAKLEAGHIGHESRISDILADLQSRQPGVAAKFRYPGPQCDQLFPAEYEHFEESSTCERCDQSKLIARQDRASTHPKIHYGLIASGNQVMKHGITRDRLAEELDVKCFEMEAAGLMDHFPCLVVRGICDYCDSHKNKRWQPYAAATAAAYAKELLSVIPGAPKSDEGINEPFRVPFDLTGIPVMNGFLGRRGDLLRLWNCLQPGKRNQRKVVVIQGLGGMGKTQLAVEFARRHKNDFTAVLWVNGQSRETVLHSMVSILSRLPGIQGFKDGFAEESIEEKASHTLRWLSMNENSKWLLVFDNVDHDGENICDSFPPADHGSILITTRHAKLARLGNYQQIRRLPTEEAMQLLVNCSGYEIAREKSAPTVKNEAKDLVNRLGCLPLAIVMAGSYIHGTGISFRNYLRHYEQSWKRMQQTTTAHLEYSNGNLLTTWKISYDEVRKRNAAAANLLLLLSYFDNQDVWFQLIRSGNIAICSIIPQWFQSIVSDETSFLTNVNLLISFSLVESNPQCSSYSVHPVVHDWCHYELLGELDQPTRMQLRMTALAAIGHAVPSVAEKQHWVLQQRVLPHANRMLACLSKSPSIPQEPALIQALHNLGLLYKSQRKPNEAKQMYQLALTRLETSAGLNYPLASRLQIINNLANLYRNQKEFHQAESLYQRALAGFEETHGPRSESILAILGNLGNLYSDQRKFAEAEEVYRRALTGFENALGHNSSSALKIVLNLGTLYTDQGKWKEAKQMFRRVVNSLHRTLDFNDPATLTVVVNIGDLCIKSGKSSKAKRIYEDALLRYEKALGPEHDFTKKLARNLQRLGSRLRKSGRR
ncbi:hypothetical protein AnigIFM63309_005802 [Aspergillus niger]|nr:hypothetical protein AnigIFM63309_005802 [Aspergillus niger]